MDATHQEFDKNAYEMYSRLVCLKEKEKLMPAVGISGSRHKANKIDLLISDQN